MASRSFSFGAGMLILLGLITLVVPGPQPIFSLIIFALSGLIALGAARAASLGRLRGSHPLSFELDLDCGDTHFNGHRGHPLGCCGEYGGGRFCWLGCRSLRADDPGALFPVDATGL